MPRRLPRLRVPLSAPPCPGPAQALIAAKRNAAEEAIAALVEALDRSFRPGDILTTDPVLSPLQSHPHAVRVRGR